MSRKRMMEANKAPGHGELHGHDHYERESCKSHPACQPKAKTVTITLTPGEVEALGYALDLAHGDQQAYLDNGSPTVDYGDEWPSVSLFKATQFRAIAQLADRAGLHGELERWNRLAEDVVGGEPVEDGK